MLKELSEIDAELLADIYNTCFEEKWSTESFRIMLSNPAYFGYKFVNDADEICGFILCQLVIDEIEIITFCVAKKFRKQGIGKVLIHKLSDYARSLHACVFLEVAENNNIAKNIYTAAGYHKIGLRKNYYNETNAIVMKLDQ